MSIAATCSIRPSPPMSVLKYCICCRLMDVFAFTSNGATKSTTPSPPTWPAFGATPQPITYWNAPVSV